MVFKCLFFTIVNRYLKGYTRLKLEKGENDMSGITQEQLAYFKEAVAVSPKADALRNAVTTNGILQAARDNRRAGELTPVFSVDLESSPVANQLQSGRENYHILSLTFGEPPVTFNFSYRDKDNNFHSDANISPKDFYAKYIGWDLSEYVSIINAPTADKPFNQTYGVKMLGSVVGGREVKHLNLDLATFKDLAVKQLLAGENVWFGVDMGPKLDRTAGLMDTKLYNEDDLFDVDFSMTKAERLEFGDSLMTHAMVLTSVDLVDGKPTKWKVENSWGDKNGHKGYFTMSDEWFDEFTYQVVIKKEHLPAELRDIYENTTPYELAPWDPMGALA